MAHESSQRPPDVLFLVGLLAEAIAVHSHKGHSDVGQCINQGGMFIAKSRTESFDDGCESVDGERCRGEIRRT